MTAPTTPPNPPDETLLQDYEQLRRREHDAITALLNPLPRIQGLDESVIAQARDALFHADTPYLMVFMGPFSSGKSSILNALLGNENLLAVGPTPTTDRITMLRWGESVERITSGGETDTVFHPSPLLKKISMVDTPGLESVFNEHETATKRFLHRSDTVVMVMLATQAMSARNLDILKTLKSYGKNLIIMINQADLLSEEEATTVREYVQDQSRAKLGYTPEVWLVSAKWAKSARSGENRDTALWEKSGLHQLERYIAEQLSDLALMRQKLQTPLQIAQNANQTAIDTLRDNQSTFDRYTTVAENVQGQLDAHRRTQEKAVRQTRDQIGTRFGEASMRGSEAIRDMFHLSGALGLAGRGLLEVVRLGGILQPRGSTATRTAFERRRAFEPLDAIPRHVDELAANLEGRDLQDMDELATYCQQQLTLLPESAQSQLIGKIKAPQRYDRSALGNVRDELAAIEQEARTDETDRLEDALRSSVIYLALYEIVLLIFIIATSAFMLSDPSGLSLVILFALLITMLIGFSIVPLRGRLLERSYTNRMLKLQSRYAEVLMRGADGQVAHGAKLREDTASPLLRLIESQTTSQQQHLDTLQANQKTLAQIEADIAGLGKRGLARAFSKLTKGSV